ncbi:helix-turn-helix transcriptional regulator [Streptomyces sp. SP17BM10]|uniref:helix-turn-helix transcriptional regulator n=1 Tax=Streptomyces sp. SP17BM10 TaxID=3002530 RepID=UPI002E79AD83|nr:helix-turn-helix transcriptional regulator [Streptomyces sp. SP17BM10]MEE1788530.1 helix-turn-helix transcriptional regulator [Streptomyces sp. SP17BM10]
MSAERLMVPCEAPGVPVPLDHDESALAELPGLASLLRDWRARAGRRLGLGKPLPQMTVATTLGMSERWYRDLERGGSARFDPRLLGRLADVLLLDADERASLYLYAMGGTPAVGPYAPEDLSSLQELVDRQMPQPAYLADHAWNVVGFNSAAAAWFPWVARPGANFVRWLLTDPEARAQMADWTRQARMTLAMIRFAMAGYPGDEQLVALLTEVLRDPVCRRLWAGRACVVANRDGDRFSLHLPHVRPEPVEVVAQVLSPGGRPDLRFVVLARP